MMRALSHVGLSLAVILAPALCCCNLRWMAAATESARCHTCPQPTSTKKTPAKPSCCQAAVCAETTPQTAPAPTPPKAPSPSCCCNVERPVAANTEAKPHVPAAEFTGEVLAVTHPSSVL
ncbi:MAG TPA: hypothetical protein VMZ71_13830, partial [Gemmataceae bacterium]|nr:hypothetical protein [Gemmataceae bacterium]